MDTDSAELLAHYLDSTMLGFSIYLTVIFAYLAVAFVAGTRLNRFQTIIISFFFVVGTTGTYAAVFLFQQLIIDLSKKVPSVLEGIPILDMVFWRIFMAVLMLGGIAGSLFFMYDIRKRGTT